VECPGAVWDALAAAARRVLMEGKQEPQHLANILWAFVKVTFEGAETIALLMEQTSKELHRFNPQCLSNTA